MRKIRLWGTWFLICVFLLNLTYFILDRSGYVRILEKYAVPDGRIESPVRILLLTQLSLVAALASWRMATSQGTYRRLSSVSTIDKVTLPVMLCVLVFYHAALLFAPSLAGLFAEDGLFESLTSFCALSASLLFFFCAKRAGYRGTRIALLAISMLTFFFGMEEISWGQRIFGWETPDTLKVINRQGETNIHNIASMQSLFGHHLFNMAVAGFMFLSDALRRTLAKRFSHGLWELMPENESPFYGFIFVFLIFQSVPCGGELTEEIFSFLCLSYAIKTAVKMRSSRAMAIGADSTSKCITRIT